MVKSKYTRSIARTEKAPAAAAAEKHLNLMHAVLYVFICLTAG
jgi:hypothetical protein